MISKRSKLQSSNKTDKMLRVYRSKDEAKKAYDKMSRFYDYFAGIFEKKYRDMALRQLCVDKGELVLEIGFGTGHCLNQIAESVGKTGKVYGIDISSGMLDVTRKRLEKAGFLDRVELTRGDAMKMPYENNRFDAAFMSFTLELFDTSEIAKVLNEIGRVLKPRGRLGIVSMSKENGESTILRLYEWAHKKFPNYADCRPIYVERSIKNASFKIEHKEKIKLFGLPGEIIICINPS